MMELETKSKQKTDLKTRTPIVPVQSSTTEKTVTELKSKVPVDIELKTKQPVSIIQTIEFPKGIGIIGPIDVFDEDFEAPDWKIIEPPFPPFSWAGSSDIFEEDIEAIDWKDIGFGIPSFDWAGSQDVFEEDFEAGDW